MPDFYISRTRSVGRSALQTAVRLDCVAVEVLAQPDPLDHPIERRDRQGQQRADDAADLRADGLRRARSPWITADLEYTLRPADGIGTAHTRASPSALPALLRRP